MAVARLASLTLVQALIRRVQAEGGFAAVLHRGDDGAGAILIQLLERNGPNIRLFERQPDFSGGYVLNAIATEYGGSPKDLAQYIERRQRSDPDLWLVELDAANAQQLAAEILLGG